MILWLLVSPIILLATPPLHPTLWLDVVQQPVLCLSLYLFSSLSLFISIFFFRLHFHLFVRCILLPLYFSALPFELWKCKGTRNSFSSQVHCQTSTQHLCVIVIVMPHLQHVPYVRCACIQIGSQEVVSRLARVLALSFPVFIPTTRQFYGPPESSVSLTRGHHSLVAHWCRFFFLTFPNSQPKYSCGFYKLRYGMRAI